MPIMIAPKSAASPAAKTRTLERIKHDEVPATHPVRLLGDAYCKLQKGAEAQHVPDLASFLDASAQHLYDYFAILVPIEADPYIDFLVMHRGGKLLGAEVAPLQKGERVTDHLLPTQATERLLELASCMAYARPRFTVASAALPSALNIKMYRAVLPVWIAHLHSRGVVLAFAPTFLLLGSNRGTQSASR